MQAGKLEFLKISDILPNRFQPRIKFDDESLNQLAISIARFGVIEPIVVRPTGKKYEIIAGERRFKASKLAGVSTIPCMVVNLSDKDSEELALLENVQRKSLSPIEEAVSYKKILDSGYITRDELSKKIGKPQSWIFGKIKLLELSDEVQNYLLNNKISERHARSLLQLRTLNEQNEMLYRIVNERLTVKATDREIDKILKSKRKIKVNDDDTENLFDDERGKEKMDIDKIMQDAKDINPEEAPKAPQAPNLMATGMDKPSELLGGQGESVSPNESGKFVSVSQPATPESSSTNSGSNGVTFDNMFAAPINSVPVNAQPLGAENAVNGAIVSNNAIDNNTSDLNTLMTGVTPLIQPSLTPAPDLIAPMNDQNTEVKDGSQEISNLMGGIIPNSYSGMADSQSNPLPSGTSVFEQSGNQVPSDVTSQSVVGTSLSSPEVVQSVPTVGPEVTNSTLAQPTEVSPIASPEATNPAFAPQPAEVSPIASPDVTNSTLAPQPTEVSPIASPDVTNSTLAPQSTEAVQSVNGVTNEATPISQTAESIPEVNISSMNPISSDNVIPMPTSLDNDRVVINSVPNAGQSISDAVSDAFKNVNNTPDVNNQNSAIGAQTVNNVSAPSLENVVTDVSNMPNYAKVVQMLRECADEIKKNGYYVGVEEVEVDGKYKVIFTIDK